MKMLFFILILIILLGCMQVDCKTETDYYQSVNVHFRITKKYIYNHKRWLDGVDSSGNVQKFGYGSFFWLDEYAKAGDYFRKDSNDLKFELIKDSIKFTFTWSCYAQDQLLEIDTLLPFPR